ncbi:hypothetical protein CERZMDRAFT_92077 [Cercospora zeae-maydis SCOH1-5]|uniref:Acyl-CoA oxidase/dehydrogenase middle domain-containing protein n=1 Tax=Cercospora zeae-maydis SCOH1-5 TaxID=717836 RepID=A0A6A6FVC7_9PEZI|nr:hypothetical protein CERZMDRAFT_92077 [Cercospora zeae-maydis SCOH1-5]
MAFGTPPILYYGSKELQDRLLPGLLLEKTRACIAVTEPGAGSDVANTGTTAVKSSDDSHYTVNGCKKWISTGTWADYATTAVRTGGPGGGGISMLVVPLTNTPGVMCRSMTLSKGQVTGITFIEYDDVRVPATNLIRKGLGLRYILTNFNHERMSMAISVLVQARRVLSTTFAYCSNRQAFGVEHLTHGMNTLPKSQSDTLLGGSIAMAKVATAKTLDCGELIEAISREVGLSRVPGGSEDILLDLSVRELMKRWERTLKSRAQSLKI